ncbi:hypothetical protein QM450_00915 [Streptococcus infantis]|uniref:hypothetical protein n=1 Tax=Streptococcus infantis TaxID=68892 RepID=UPI0039C318D5
MTLEERVAAIEKRLNMVRFEEPKVALLISQSTYHKIIDQIVELESGNLEKELEEEDERSY